MLCVHCTWGGGGKNEHDPAQWFRLYADLAINVTIRSDVMQVRCGSCNHLAETSDLHHQDGNLFFHLEMQIWQTLKKGQG